MLRSWLTPIRVHVQTEMQPSALLDLRFNPVEGKRDLCAVVSSTATLALFRMTPGEGQEKPLKHIKTMDMTSMLRHADDSTAETEVLFTAFSWHPTRGDLVAITTTSGHVYLVDLGPDLEGEWQMHPEPVITHSLEAWCVVIHPPFGSATSSSEDTFELFSGGDDSALRYASCDRIPEEGNLSGTRVDYQLLPLGANTKSHGAGVVAILPLRVVEDGTNAGIYTKLYVTGSYDDNIRLFSSQNPRSPLVESNLGGGVWRLKLIDMDQQDPSDGKAWRARILVSCMHAGVRVVELIKSVTGEWEFRVIGRFEEHKSMNYGSDFVHDVVADELTVVSTSFYDKLLCLWKLNMSKDKKLAEKTEGMSLQ